MLERGGGGQVRPWPAAIRSRSRSPTRVSRLVLLGRVAELGEAVVEDAVLAAVHRLLADEAGDLPLERRVGDLVAEVAHRAHEVVLAVGEHRRQGGDDVARDQVAVLGEVARAGPASTPRRTSAASGPSARGCSVCPAGRCVRPCVMSVRLPLG